MKTYNFKAANWIVLVFVMTFIPIGVIFACILLIDKVNILIAIPCCAGIVFLAIYAIRLTSFAKVEITLENDAFSMKWLEQFLFSNRQNITIPFHEIASYIDSGDYYWDWLKIEKIDGSIYKIWHSNWFFSKGDYDEFVVAFVTSVKNYNENNLTNNKTDKKTKIIKRKQSIYETTGGLILAGFCVLIIIGLPIFLLLSPVSSSRPNYFGLFIGYGGAIYYLVQVYVHRKRKKINDGSIPKTPTE